MKKYTDEFIEDQILRLIIGIERIAVSTLDGIFEIGKTYKIADITDDKNILIVANGTEYCITHEDYFDAFLNIPS